MRNENRASDRKEVTYTSSVRELFSLLHVNESAKRLRFARFKIREGLKKPDKQEILPIILTSYAPSFARRQKKGRMGVVE